jgi:hypothetical protein
VGARRLDLDHADLSLRGLIETLVERYPALGTPDDILAKYELFLNDTHVETGEAGCTAVHDGDTVLLLTGISGGSDRGGAWR